MAGLFLFCLPVCSLAQSSGGNRLTWKDFTPASADSIGMTSRLVVGVSQALVQGKNNRFRDLYMVEVETKSSLYDPTKVSDWDLRYNQILYDMALLSMKQAIQDNHNGQVGIYEIYARYSQLYDESKREFIVNSISGRDTAVIKDYENRMKDEMAGIKSEDFYTKDFSLSAMGASPFSNMSAGYYIALIAGYENNWFLTGLSDNFGLWNGFNISAELHIKSKFRFEMQFSRLWSDIKTPGFYYDSDNDYHWDDNKANEMIIRIGAGFEVLSKDKISLIPFAGLQSAEVYQNTSIKDQKGNKIRSNIPDGGGVYLGMDIDYRPKGTYGLRLRVFGSYGSFDKTVNTWSLNTGLTILFPKDF
ncbi:MAG: hypothetical protein J6W42_10480 [Bacteroidaceae bacterium]|nr:hypothetical protein [Bacteroidaceae bacterium]